MKKQMAVMVSIALIIFVGITVKGIISVDVLREFANATIKAGWDAIGLNEYADSPQLPEK